MKKIIVVFIYWIVSCSTIFAQMYSSLVTKMDIDFPYANNNNIVRVWNDDYIVLYVEDSGRKYFCLAKYQVNPEGGGVNTLQPFIKLEIDPSWEIKDFRIYANHF